MELLNTLSPMWTESVAFTDISVSGDNTVAGYKPGGWMVVAGLAVTRDDVEQFACEVLNIPESNGDGDSVTAWQERRDALYQRLRKRGACNEAVTLSLPDRENASLRFVRVRVDVSLVKQPRVFSDLETTISDFDSLVASDEQVIELMIRRAASIMPIANLDLPPALLIEHLVARQGLILVTGRVRSGKTASCASMLDYLNQNHTRRIITIEDPIEYHHQNDRCLFSMKEVDADSGMTFAALVRNTLRQSPDVVLISELRDAETVRQALLASQSMLVIATLHAATPEGALERMVNYAPEDAAVTLRALRSSLLCVLSQTLITQQIGDLRMFKLFYEYITGANPLVQKGLEDGDFKEMRDVINRAALMHVGDNKAAGAVDATVWRTQVNGLVPMTDKLVKAVDAGEIGLLDGRNALDPRTFSEARNVYNKHKIAVEQKRTETASRAA